MKKTVLILLALCLLLSGCATQSGEEGSTTAAITTTAKPTGDGDAVRLAYYEQLVQEMQQEVLALKAEIYVNRVEYEALIEQLSGAGGSSGNAAPSDTEQPTKGDAPEGEFRYRIENGAATVTEYVGEAKEIVIPDSLGGYPVRAVGDRAFADRRTLVAVAIPEGVTQIGWFAFSGCILLERVAIPGSVEAICYGAFQNCKSTLTVSCPKESYAAQYAKSYGIAVTHPS